MNIFLDDDTEFRQSPQGFVHIQSMQECKELLRTGKVDILSLDHDLGEDPITHQPIETYKLALWMVEYGIFPNRAIFIHSMNPVGRDNLYQLLTHYKPDSLMVYPYSYQAGS